MGMLGIAFTGGGKRDDELTVNEKQTAMFVSQAAYPQSYSCSLYTVVVSSTMSQTVSSTIIDFVQVHHANHVLPCRHPRQMGHLLHLTPHRQW